MWIDRAIMDGAITVEAKDKPLHKDPRINSTLKRAAESGWRWEPSGNGQKWYCPCGEHRATVHKTLSDHRVALEIKKDFRKCPVTRAAF